MRSAALFSVVVPLVVGGTSLAEVPRLLYPPSAYRVAPDYQGPVPPRIDVIGPLGNRLPPGPRRSLNRPTKVGGAITNAIAPSSREAMSWQRSNALGLYENDGLSARLGHHHCPPGRVEQHYFYPKPWEAIRVGPRPTVKLAAETRAANAGAGEDYEMMQAAPAEIDDSLPPPTSDIDGITDPRSEPEDLLPEANDLPNLGLVD